MFNRILKDITVQWLRLPLAVMCAVFMLNASAQAQLAIVPAPAYAELYDGVYTLDEGFSISFNQGAAAVAEYLARSLAPALGFTPVIQKVSAAPEQGIFLQLSADPIVHQGVALSEEGYALQVTGNGVSIRASGISGLFYGVQSLRQLLPVEAFAATAQSVEWQLPHVSIIDQPRFEWRGMHLDVSRHIMPVDFVKKFIDLLALHKMNRFHWHLSEDQGWRLEIKKYPRLTEIGAWRDGTVMPDADKPTLIERLLFWRKSAPQHDGQPYGGFYTQAEVRDIVAYAQQRHVVVVPAIELPGHAQAAIAAYPELSSGDEPVKVMTTWGVSQHVFNPEESTINFLKDVLAEVITLFPGDYIHIGADEVDKTEWTNSARVQQLMRERGLQNEEELQSWFIEQIDVFLSANGKRMLAWYEDGMLEGNLSEGAIVMPWRSGDTGVDASRSKQDVVMAHGAYTYFDYYQSKAESEPKAIGGYIPLKKVYGYNPIPKNLEEKHVKQILGAQGQLWTEYMKTPGQVEYMAFPRVSALAEVLWLNQPREARDYKNFLRRLEIHQQRLDFMNVNYRP